MVAIFIKPAEVLLLYNHTFFVVRAEEFHGIPDKNRDFAIQFFCPSYIPMVNIVASLADFRHPDVTLESGLVLNTIGDL